MGIVTDDVLSQKFRWLLADRMLHTINMLSLAGYLQSTTLIEHACPVHVFMEPALGCSLGLWFPAWIKRDARIFPPFTCRCPSAVALGAVVLPHIVATVSTDCLMICIVWISYC